VLVCVGREVRKGREVEKFEKVDEPATPPPRMRISSGLSFVMLMLAAI